MGLWDSLRGLFGGRASPPQPQPTVLLREWRFADDREWSTRTLDAATLQVYADWLEERGDARHELIRRAPMPEQFRAFVDANTAALFGSLAKFITWPEDRHKRARSQLEPQWEAGVLRGVSVRTEPDNGSDLWTDAHTFLRLPIARTVRRVAFGIPTPLEPVADAADLASLAQYADRLDEVFIGDFRYPDECEMSWAQLGDLSALWSALPKLKKVKLRGLATLGSIEAPELTHFTLETSGLTRDEVKAVIGARWPRLEHLELWFGDENYGCDCAVADVEPLLHANFPSLRSLGLRNFNYVEGLVPRLAATPLIRQLERLDLSMGTLDDEGAEVLLRARSAFAHLGELDLSDNYLSGAQFEPLSTLCASVNLGKQRDPNDEQRYVSVTE